MPNMPGQWNSEYRALIILVMAKHFPVSVILGPVAPLADMAGDLLAKQIIRLVDSALTNGSLVSPINKKGGIR